MPANSYPGDLYEQILADAFRTSLEGTDRERAWLVLPNLDYEAQLIAISGLLERNDDADELVEARMKNLEECARKSGGRPSERAVDLWGEYFYVSVYQSAAHSMAALGMIAPLFESMFFQAFQGIRTRFFGTSIAPSGTIRSAINDSDKFWDCHLYYDRQKGKIKDNLVAGIHQLSKVVGLKPHLPADLQNTLAALFAYRNQMFHNGFEWPEKRCEEFAARIEQTGWQEWFSGSTRADKPWIFYMTDKFIEHCLDVVHRVLESFGSYCRKRDALDEIHPE